MGQFHIEDRLKNQPDIIRVYNFEVIIPDIGSVTDSVKDSDDLVIRARIAAIPSRGNEKIESNFVAMKQFFPGKPTFSNTISITFEEFEDQLVSKAMYEWSNRIFDTRANSPTGGGSQVTKKRDIAKDIIIKQFDYATQDLEKAWKLHNCFIENVEEIALDYTANESIKVPVTFSFDFFELLKL
jgi:hypothetical protein